MVKKEFIVKNFGESKLIDYLTHRLNEIFGKENYYNSLGQYVIIDMSSEELFILDKVEDILTDYEKQKIGSVVSVLNNEDMGYLTEDELAEAFYDIREMGISDR